jgi:prolyl oligopeptidase PreP (S9A serine peptidase family)
MQKSISTWKKEFRHWMTKYSQDKDEQLQRFRKAMPKGLWWTDQVKTCKSIDRAWEILDVEFADKRKLMDELLTGINNQKSNEE